MKIRTKETETPRRREYRRSHLVTARQHDKEVYARKKINAEWMRRRKENAFQERLNVKLAVLSHYGFEGKLQCAWPECPVTDVDMLTLDHVFDDGAVDRKVNQRGCGTQAYRCLRRTGYPNGFQTLCGSHQLKKKIMFERTNA
jgi:hypothetical protein